jgi:hypothetical protein
MTTTWSSTFNLVKDPILKTFDELRPHPAVVDDRREFRPLRNACDRSLDRG